MQRLGPALVIDLSGMPCPYSLLEFSAALRGMKSGEAARVIIDRDPAVEDIRRWCEATGDEVVSVERGGEAGAAGGTGERPDGRGNPLRISIVVRKK